MKKCTNCGACPNCGHVPYYGYYHYPYYQYPYWNPIIQTTPTWTTITTTAGDTVLDGNAWSYGHNNTTTFQINTSVIPQGW